MSITPSHPANQNPDGTPRPNRGPAAEMSFPAVTTVLAGYDFHTYAMHQSPASLLNGRSAGVSTSPKELLESAVHQPGDLPLQVRTAGARAKRAGISLAASFLSFWAGGFYGAFATFYPDTIGITLLLIAFAVFFLAVYHGVAMVNRMIRGPELDLAATREAIEEKRGPLPELPVIFVGEHQLPADERVLLQQMCGLYNLLQERGYPMAAGQWKSLTAAALDSVRQHRVSGELGIARSVGDKIMEWMEASEAAMRTRTEFTTRGIIPPHF